MHVDMHEHSSLCIGSAGWSPHAELLLKRVETVDVDHRIDALEHGVTRLHFVQEIDDGVEGEAAPKWRHLRLSCVGQLWAMCGGLLCLCCCCGRSGVASVEERNVGQQPHSGRACSRCERSWRAMHSLWDASGARLRGAPSRDRAHR
eukprot:1467948-Prymnesium_polylepis.1